MDIRKLSNAELSEMHKRGSITTEKLEAEITRRSSFSLSGILSRFIAKENADWQLYGATEGNDWSRV